MRYETQYNPNLTATCKTYIENNLKPSFESNDTNIYDLEYILEELSFEIEQNEGKDIFGITNNDIEELEKLMTDQIEYVEF